MNKFLATIDFNNPIANDDLISLVKSVMNWMIYIAGPIAVIAIIFAGVVLLTSQGNPERIKRGRKILGYAIVGLAIILIGRGFITLIQSIIDLAK